MKLRPTTVPTSRCGAGRHRVRRSRARLAVPALVLALLGGVLAVPPSALAAVDLPVGMAAMNSAFPATPGEVTQINAPVTVDVAEVTDQGYFYARTFGFPGDRRGGYMGLQTNGNLPFGQGRAPRVARFSIFDNDDKIVDVRPAGGNCERADTTGGDGNFVGCAIEYNWQLDRQYTLQVEEVFRDATTSHWQGSVLESVTFRRTVIGTISVANHWGSLEGRVGGFVEYFRGALNDCRDMPYTFAWFGTATANYRDAAGVNRLAVAALTAPPHGYGICGLGRAAQVRSLTFLESGFASTPQDAVALTIDHWYRAGLHRNPDFDGRASWLAQVPNGLGAESCAKSLRKVAIGILSSAEYLGGNPGTQFDPHGPKVTYLYLSALHRNSDAGGAAHWRARAAQIGWPNTIVEFTGSPEALNMFNLICTRR